MIWINPNEINDISLAKYCRNVARLDRYGLIINKSVIVHSRESVPLRNEAKREGRHAVKSSDRLVLSWLRL